MRKVFLVRSKFEDQRYLCGSSRTYSWFGPLERARLFNRRSDAQCSLNVQMTYPDEWEVVEGKVSLEGPDKLLVFALQYDVDTKSGMVNVVRLTAKEDEIEAVRGN